MEQAIYYPGFEVRDQNWLKFALLYVDRLNPIIPPAGDRYLSDMYRRLRDETDLIIPHRPDYEEGQAATLDAIEMAGRILKHPPAYSAVFFCPDVVAVWRDPKNWQYTLFEDKYTKAWENFCLTNRLAKRAPEGLLLEKSLGLVYMSILAHAISEHRGVSPLTDYPEMDQISLITRRASPLTPQRIHVARGIIKLQLPADLARIDVEKVIKHRQRNGFKDRLHAFHVELAQWMEEVESGEAKADFFQSRGSAISEFSDDIVSLGAGATTFGLGVWLLLSTPAASAEYLKQISAGVVLAVGSIIALRKTWKHTKSKRFTRKYLADLKRIE
jgi:hypothetical protein